MKKYELKFMCTDTRYQNEFILFLVNNGFEVYKGYKEPHEPDTICVGAYDDDVREINEN